MLRAARKARGSASTAAANVPSSEMATVSSRAEEKTRTCAQSLGSGGSIRPAISSSRPMPASSLPSKKPSSAMANTSKVKAAATKASAVCRRRSKRWKCSG